MTIAALISLKGNLISGGAVLSQLTKIFMKH